MQTDVWKKMGSMAFEIPPVKNRHRVGCGAPKGLGVGLWLPRRRAVAGRRIQRAPDRPVWGSEGLNPIGGQTHNRLSEDFADPVDNQRNNLEHISLYAYLIDQPLFT